MVSSNEATPLELDPISAQIIRKHLIHSIERISDDDLEEPTDETTDTSEITDTSETTDTK